ncbi:MAG TPA: hypothetical protein P5061_15045, partial [Mycobacterium sp.]|nr:hypothetical protein [Mycobacterium sp.]
MHDDAYTPDDINTDAAPQADLAPEAAASEQTASEQTAPEQTAPEAGAAPEQPAPLEDELPERLRVHSLARVLGTTSRRVLDALVELDGRTRSAHSSV